jgi:O-antigen/teichoic acid export membrane protein
MYLDHVTDAMLKGVGEQVYSMWVNISDSFLSIILVWTLIPRLGIIGYAIAIIGMEAYNFFLSAARLRRHVSLKIDPWGSLIRPLLFALIASTLARSIFSMNGSVTTPTWLAFKMIFSLAVFIAEEIIVDMLRGGIRRRKKV